MGKHQFNLNTDEQNLVDKIFNFENVSVQEREQAIKKFILSIENETILTVKEQIELENLKIKQATANRINEKESLKLRKLEAETELIERELVYSNTFGKFRVISTNLAKMRKEIPEVQFNDLLLQMNNIIGGKSR